jgi:chloramphenicol O-acetyltransferase type A
MASYIDIDSWPRRDLFRFFRNFEFPFFSVTVQADVTDLLHCTRSTDDLSYSSAVHYCSLRAANETPEFRLRLRGDRVFSHDVIHGGTTVLVADDRFVFTYFEYESDFRAFQAGMRGAVRAAQAGDVELDGAKERDDLIYHTSVPWITFTGLSHTRASRTESVPQVAFGRYYESDKCMLMPVSADAHHALVDGLHMGRFLERMQRLLASPESWI